jgi:hypothetical protein
MPRVHLQPVLLRKLPERAPIPLPSRRILPAALRALPAAVPSPSLPHLSLLSLAMVPLLLRRRPLLCVTALPLPFTL